MIDKIKERCCQRCDRQRLVGAVALILALAIVTQMPVNSTVVASLYLGLIVALTGMIATEHRRLFAARGGCERCER